MAFNANLNRIRMEDERNGNNVDRIASLKALLKSDKNKDFTDQIYYRIGDIYLERQQLSQAIESYHNAIRRSTKNQTQKGQAYLKLAEVYFSTGNYAKAKAYYDTTLTTLPPSFRDYDLIKRKAANLDLLANRFRIIAREDTLQTLARMDQSEREERIGELVREQAGKAIDQADNPPSSDSFTASIDKPGTGLAEGKFYFNNTTAISRGFSDFKRRWGNRPLSDNWRRSNKTASEITESAGNHSGNGLTTGTGITDQTDLLFKEYMNSLPLTPENLRLSNERVAAAMYDIASFYKDELKDNKEAVSGFEALLKRVPGSSYEPAVLYNLYLLYAGTGQERSDGYRNTLLKDYPGSPFAKVILNPGYGRENDEKEAALNRVYNEIYDLYTQRQYAAVIQQAALTEQQYGRNTISPQLAYLSALALGHTSKLPSFENSLKSLADTFVTNQLVTPLVKQHLQYINDHREEMNSRPTALLDYDPDNNIFMEPEAQIPAATAKVNPENKPKVSPGNKQKEDLEKKTPDVPVPADTKDLPPAAAQNDKALSMFSMPDSAEYYFVVNVMAPGLNLSPSRFGIGQFNRVKLADFSIKHQLKAVNNENQLIFVGPFYSRTAVTNYERNILPLMKDIMRIPAGRYNTFVISKEELEKLNTRTMINLYLEFYKNNR